MKIITQNHSSDKKIFSSITIFFTTYKISAIFKASNAYKKKGVPVVLLFQYLFSLIFANRSMYMNRMTGKHDETFGKDTVYRFLNSSSINWTRFTSLLASKIANTTITNLSDGNTFLPINSCLLSTENKKNRVTEVKPLDKRTSGYRRRALTQTKATTVMFELIDLAMYTKIPATHVLFDTWFCSPSSLIAIKKKKLDVIAMAKKTPKMHYLYNGKMQPLTEIYKQNKKRRGRSKYLLSAIVTLIDKNGESIPARIIYVRNRNKKKDYLALITTDLSINEEEAIRIYGKRWDIEVFFKVCKSYLKLSKGCNSLSYDAMSAHTAIVFTRYMMLAVENRNERDCRTLGEIFYFITDEMSDITWIQSFYMLMQLFIDTIKDKFSLTTEQLDELMDKFLVALPTSLGGSLGLYT